MEEMRWSGVDDCHLVGIPQRRASLITDDQIDECSVQEVDIALAMPASTRGERTLLDESRWVHRSSMESTTVFSRTYLHELMPAMQGSVLQPSMMTASSVVDGDSH